MSSKDGVMSNNRGGVISNIYNTRRVKKKFFLEVPLNHYFSPGVIMTSLNPYSSYFDLANIEIPIKFGNFWYIICPMRSLSQFWPPAHGLQNEKIFFQTLTCSVLMRGLSCWASSALIKWQSIPFSLVKMQEILTTTMNPRKILLE